VSEHFVFNGKDPKMEQIDGLAHELISYGQNHKMMCHFDISATETSKDKGFLSSTAFQNPET
jgi:hypothetical protein